MKDQLVSTAQWFDIISRHKPNQNSREDNLGVQLGCHVEEFIEMLDVLLKDNPDMLSLLSDKLNEVKSMLMTNDSSINLTRFNNSCDTFNEIDTVELLDALGDQLVTATGSVVLAGYDPSELLEEINHSNYSKFQEGTPVFNEHGKVIKPTSFVEPNIENIVRRSKNEND